MEELTTVYVLYSDHAAEKLPYKDLPKSWTLVNSIKHRHYPIEHQFVGPYEQRYKFKKYLAKRSAELGIASVTQRESDFNPEITEDC